VTDAQAFSTVVTGLMGTVLGYYFGANGKQASDVAAQTATAKATATTAQAQKAHIRVTEVRARLQAQKGPMTSRAVAAEAPGSPETGVADEIVAALMQA